MPDLAYLPLVIEEAAEVIQAITKLQRFGRDYKYLTGSHKGETNLEALAYEIGDLLAVIHRLGLPENLIKRGIGRKHERLKLYGPENWRPGIESEEEIR